MAPTGHSTFVLTHLPFHWLGHKLTTFFHAHFDPPERETVAPVASGRRVEVNAVPPGPCDQR